MNKQDLSLVSIDNLLEEAEKRCVTFIAAYELPDEKDQQDMFNTWHGKGTWKDSVGLAGVLCNHVTNNWAGELSTLRRIHEEGIH